MNLLREQPPSIFVNFAPMPCRSMSYSIRKVSSPHIKESYRIAVPLVVKVDIAPVNHDVRLSHKIRYSCHTLGLSAFGVTTP